MENVAKFKFEKLVIWQMAMDIPNEYDDSLQRQDTMMASYSNLQTYSGLQSPVFKQSKP